MYVINVLNVATCNTFIYLVVFCFVLFVVLFIHNVCVQSFLLLYIIKFIIQEKHRTWYTQWYEITHTHRRVRKLHYYTQSGNCTVCIIFTYTYNTYALHYFHEIHHNFHNILFSLQYWWKSSPVLTVYGQREERCLLMAWNWEYHTCTIFAETMSHAWTIGTSRR